MLSSVERRTDVDSYTRRNQCKGTRGKTLYISSTETNSEYFSKMRAHHDTTECCSKCGNDNDIMTITCCRITTELERECVGLACRALSTDILGMERVRVRRQKESGHSTFRREVGLREIVVW